MSHVLGCSATVSAKWHHLSTLQVLGYLCQFGVCVIDIIFVHGIVNPQANSAGALVSLVHLSESKSFSYILI